MKKIGEIKGVPVVEGNINEVNKNQIHYKENNGNIQLSKRGNDNKLNSVTGSSSGGGSSSGEYYLVDENLITQYLIPDVASIEFLILYGSLFKATPRNKQIIGTGMTLYTYLPENIKFSDIIAVKFDKMFSNETGILSFKELISGIEGIDATSFDKAFPRITEEEFYDLNKWSLEDYK